MKTPWVGIINVAELLVLCLPRNTELSTNQMKVSSWVCGTFAGKFFFSAFFSRGIRDDIEEEDDQVSSYAVFLFPFLFGFWCFFYLPSPVM